MLIHFCSKSYFSVLISTPGTLPLKTVHLKLMRICSPINVCWKQQKVKPRSIQGSIKWIPKTKLWTSSLIAYCWALIGWLTLFFSYRRSLQNKIFQAISIKSNISLMVFGWTRMKAPSFISNIEIPLQLICYTVNFINN